MNFETFTSQIYLLTDEELQELSNKCCELYGRRKEEKRKELKAELKKNLMRAIEDILNNDFYLSIEKTDRPEFYVSFKTDEIETCEIELE